MAFKKHSCHQSIRKHRSSRYTAVPTQAIRSEAISSTLFSSTMAAHVDDGSDRGSRDQEPTRSGGRHTHFGPHLRPADRRSDSIADSAAVAEHKRPSCFL